MKKAVLFGLICLLLATVCAGCRKNEKVMTSISDAETARIGVMTGSSEEALALIKFPKAQIKSFDDIMDAVTALKSGQVDAVLTAFSAAHQVAKLNQELWCLPESLHDDDIAIAIKKGNEELLAGVNRIIAELQADGTLADIKRRWFKPELTPYEERTIALPQEGKPLAIGVSATREPFSFVDKAGRTTGHDGELARIIGARLHRPVEFVNMKFMAMIPALQSGKVDMIVSGMTATDERRLAVNFSQPYFIDQQVLLVKKAGPGPDAPASLPAAKPHTSEGIASLEQIDGKRIGVLSGSAGDMAARKHFPHAQFQVLTAAADAALAITTNKADAFVYDKSVLLNLAQKNPELVILDAPVDKLELAAAIKKENTALLSAINGVLLDLKKEGALQRLRLKWVDTKYAATPPMPPRSTAQTKGILKMGTCAIIEPFSFQAEGRITGLDIELSQLIGERLGKKIEIMDMNFEALIPALQSGKIDFALSNFNVTEERKKLILFTLPYIENDISALVRRSPAPGQVVAQSLAGKPSETAGPEHARIASVADLKDKRIGVLIGSIHDAYAMQHYPKAVVLQYKSPSDLVLAVKSGKVDAGMYTRETLIALLRDDRELGLVGESLLHEPIAVGFSRGNDQLREQCNAFLRQIRQNGVYDDMVDRWMHKGGTQMPTIANTRANGQLVIGNVSDKGMPFTAVINNQLVGFDIELAERFAASLGKAVKFADMEFSNLMAAAATGKIDMIASTLVITEERQKKVDFSDPYYALGAHVFALKKNIAAADTTAATGTVSVPFLQGVANSFRSNILQENRYLLIVEGLQTTVVISVFATVFGTLLGALVCLMRMSKNRALNLPARVYIAILRGTPVLVLLMLIYYVVFASVSVDPVLVAVIAFGMNFAAYVAEIFRSGIEGVDHGQTEAGIAMGFTRVTTFFYIVLPQTVRRILPIYKGEFISLVKMTSIVGYIAVQDLTKASDIIRSRTFDAFFPLVMVAILYFLISWVLMQALEYLERTTDPKYQRRKVGTL